MYRYILFLAIALFFLSAQKKGYVTHKQKIGNLSFKRFLNGSYATDALIIDTHGLIRPVKDLQAVSDDLLEKQYGKGSRASIRQVRRVRKGIDAEIVYDVSVKNARVGDAFKVFFADTQAVHIACKTEGDLGVSIYLTSFGKGASEGKIQTNKAIVEGEAEFDIRKLVGTVEPFKNDQVSFVYYPDSMVNAQYPYERLRMKVLRRESLKTIGG